MKKTNISILLFLLILTLASTVVAQRKRPMPKPKQIIFAVTNDGKTLEPIAEIQNGKFVERVGADNDPKELGSFTKTYYKPKTSYDLVFGGSVAGKVLVDKSNAASECGKNLADVTTQSAKAKLKGLVMALATNLQSKKVASGVRRLPTSAERIEAEKLVREEFTKNKITSSVLKTLNYHNLTALDLDNDGKAELVGSYWISKSATERALLFFIAEKDKSGKYKISFNKFVSINQDNVMSGNIKDLDTGINHELLLDVLDIDGDGVSEIFTIGRALEGNNFTVYKRREGKWTTAFETYNYHCAY